MHIEVSKIFKRVYIAFFPPPQKLSSSCPLKRHGHVLSFVLSVAHRRSKSSYPVLLLPNAGLSTPTRPNWIARIWCAVSLASPPSPKHVDRVSSAWTRFNGSSTLCSRLSKTSCSSAYALRGKPSCVDLLFCRCTCAHVPPPPRLQPMLVRLFCEAVVCSKWETY
jgi:hypothetical protein